VNDQLKKKLEEAENKAEVWVKGNPDTEFDFAQDHKCLNLPAIGSREDKQSLNGGYPIERDYNY
jgi:hypothetical protein